MTRRVIALVLFCASFVTPLAAELKYTMRVEVKPSTVPSGPANPMLAPAGQAMMQQLVPGGPADVVYIVGDKGLRTEYKQAALGNVAGAVVLVRPNGDVVTMDTNAKTYWKMTAAEMTKALQALPITPKVTTTKSGEFSDVAGLKTERVAFQISIDLPIPEELRAQMPPGFPTSLMMGGDVWVATEKYKAYAALAAKSGSSVQGMGLDKLMQDGLMMKQVMRSDIFSGQQIEMTVTSIGEEAVAASLFDIPADYKQVPSPAAGIGG